MAENQRQPAPRSSSSRDGSTIHSLPDRALLLIFLQLSTALLPGICLAAQVCRRWRHVATTAEGLSVLFNGSSSCSINSGTKYMAFMAWLTRYGYCLEVLTLAAAPGAAWVLNGLRQAAAAAMHTGRPLPLKALCVYTRWPLQDTCILYHLPHLQRLHLELSPQLRLYDGPGIVAPACRLLLAPLQQATSLQQLVLDGPVFQEDGEDEVGESSWKAAANAVVQLVRDALPSSLRLLRWRMQLGMARGGFRPTAAVLDAGRLTQLEELKLEGFFVGQQQVACLASSSSLQRLHLSRCGTTAEYLQQLSSKLVAWRPAHAPCLEDAAAVQQLAQLRLLEVPAGAAPSVLQPVLSSSSGLQHLALPLGTAATGGLPGDHPVLQQLSALRGLRGLELLRVPWTCSALAVAALQQLTLLRVGLPQDEVHTGAAQARLEPWRLALGYLRNLVVLRVTVPLVASTHPWLTHLPRLTCLYLDGPAAWDPPAPAAQQEVTSDNEDSSSEEPEQDDVDNLQLLAQHLAAVHGSNPTKQRLLVAVDGTRWSWSGRDAFREQMSTAAPSWDVLLTEAGRAGQSWAAAAPALLVKGCSSLHWSQ